MFRVIKLYHCWTISFWLYLLSRLAFVLLSNMHTMDFLQIFLDSYCVSLFHPVSFGPSIRMRNKLNRNQSTIICNEDTNDMLLTANWRFDENKHNVSRHCWLLYSWSAPRPSTLNSCCLLLTRCVICCLSGYTLITHLTTRQRNADNTLNDR